MVPQAPGYCEMGEDIVKEARKELSHTRKGGSVRGKLQGGDRERRTEQTYKAGLEERPWTAKPQPPTRSHAMLAWCHTRRKKEFLETGCVCGGWLTD